MARARHSPLYTTWTRSRAWAELCGEASALSAPSEQCASVGERECIDRRRPMLGRRVLRHEVPGFVHHDGSGEVESLPFSPRQRRLLNCPWHYTAAHESRRELAAEVADDLRASCVRRGDERVERLRLLEINAAISCVEKVLARDEEQPVEPAGALDA